MGKYESDADAVLEKKGVEPDEPLILLTLGDKTREVYKGFIDDAKGDTIADRQRDALDKTFKALDIIQVERWREQYKKQGYIMLYSPHLGEPFYLARDSHAFDILSKKENSLHQWKDKLGVKLAYKKDLAVYMESELPRLKGLDKEMLYWLHQGKKFGGKILKGERNERGKQ